MKKYIHIITISALALLAASSCQKEPQLEGPAAGGNILSFSVSPSAGWNNNAPATKSSYAGEMQLTNDQGQTVNVSISVIDGIESGPIQRAETKGAMITGQTLGSYQIKVNSFIANTDNAYFSDRIKKVDDSHQYVPEDDSSAWTPSGHWATVGGTYYWPKTSNLDIWAYAPYAAEGTGGTSRTFSEAIANTEADQVTVSGLNIRNSEGKLDFSYDLGTGTAAEDMPDLMIASVRNQAKTVTGCVPLPFMHALSSVQFKVKARHGGYISTITLGNLAKTGDCSVDGLSGDFTWSRNTGTDGTYSHDFDTALASDTYSDFYNPAGGNPAATFMMIPQAIGKDAKPVSVTVASEKGITPMVYSGFLPEGNWQPGMNYIYVINIDEQGINIKLIVEPWHPEDVEDRLVFNG